MATTNKRIEMMRKAKDRRNRIIAAGGGVLLLILVGYQGPKTWKQLHPSTPASPAVASPSAPTPSGTQPVGAPVTPVGSLADTKIQTPVGAGQLASFGRFEWKDPFHQQISTASPTTTTPAAAPKPARTAPAAPLVVQMGKGSSPSADAGVAPGIVISMNGIAVRIVVGSTFPSGDPIFRLVSFKHHRARIGLTSGSFANGKKTLLLLRGRPLTLLNTTAGTKYKLKLVSWSTAS